MIIVSPENLLLRNVTRPAFHELWNKSEIMYSLAEKAEFAEKRKSSDLLSVMSYQFFPTINFSLIITIS